MSEAELHLMQQRMRQGLVAKARRGALRIVPPMGYLERTPGEITFDPDEQIQQAIRLIFRKFDELGTVNALLRYLVTHQIQVGMREQQGPARGSVVGRRPNRTTLQNLLKHPIYAGAYVYGRRRVDRHRQQAGRPETGRVVVGPEAWLVCLKDRLPAYIAWEQYEANVARLQANRVRAESMGVAREGPALLTRLVICARCRRRMAVSYTGNSGHFSYECARMRIAYGADLCHHLAGACLDAFVSQQVLAALEPAALELSLAAATHLEAEWAELTRLWHQKVERATYEAERAGRQYRLVEPENRLVVRQLEPEWEEKLAAQYQVEDEYRRFLETEPRGLTAAERAAIRQLAADMPPLWHAPTTGAAERKEIIRQVVQRVVVAMQGESERVQVTIEWVGGAQTTGAIVRPVARLDQPSYDPHLGARVRQLAAEGLTAAAIAERLNADGARPPKRRERLGAQGVQELLQRLGVRTKHNQVRQPSGLGPQEWGLRELAQELGMPHVTLSNWIGRGWVTARRDPATRRWII